MLPTEMEIKNVIESIKKDVEEIKNSNDKLAASNKWNELTKNFKYLQVFNRDVKAIPEYEEAKKLIFSLEENDPQFVEYFKSFMDEK